MKLSYQEQIIDYVINNPRGSTIEHHYQFFDATKDCFAISRLEAEIDYFHNDVVVFDDIRRKEMAEAYEQLQEILTKYGIKAE